MRSARTRRALRAAMAGTLGALLGASAATASAAEGTACELEAGPRRTVARVVDGETLALDDGSEVRLVGALAPRAAAISRSGRPSARPRRCSRSWCSGA